MSRLSMGWTEIARSAHDYEDVGPTMGPTELKNSVQGA
jgi:hypothetical protein